MKVLMITGDKNIFTPGSEAHSRFVLQQHQVEQLDAVYVGRGSIAPTIKDTAYDVITSQDPFWRGLFAWRVAQRRGAKLNVQVHADLLAHSFVKRTLARFVLSCANSVRVVSKKIQEQVQALGVTAPIQVLPVYIDINRFKNIQHTSQYKNTILWIGRFEDEKDPLYALDVLKEVRASGIDAKLILLGKGALEGRLREAAQGMPVEFPGWQPPEVYLSQVSVVLCTSKHESWGASIVEALLAGVPVVAPDVGVAKEAGAYIAERNALAKRVEEVLQNNAKGDLHITLLDAEAWSKAWSASLTF